MIRVLNLRERPDLIETTALWGWNEWGRPSGALLADHIARRSAIVAAAGFEACFVLLDGDAPAGMAALVRADMAERPDLTPWLAGVYVPPAFRGRGHGVRVVQAVEDAARRSGVDTLWLYTRTAAALYRRLGWQDHEEVARAKGPTLLMRRDLSVHVTLSAPSPQPPTERMP